MMEEFQTSNEYNELKLRVHEKLIDALDLALIEGLDEGALKKEIRKATEGILAGEGSVVPLNRGEKERFYHEVQDEVLGFGPIEPLMRDPTVSDILINSYRKVYIEQFGKLHPTTVRFKDESHLRKIIDRIVSAVGRRIDESCPMVDARLPDGSRVNAIIPPLAIDGACVSIRRFATDPLELDDLINLDSITPEIGELLKGLVRARQNIIISGGTGTGKTTLLNVLSRFVPEDERIVTIEDSAELQMKQAHVVRLETRPANIEGKGEITQRDLVRNSLRMRPDRIIVGEVRGAEVVDMLQAMNTGHDGSLTTIHSNSPRDSLLRLETLVAIAGLNIPNDAVRSYIGSAIDVIIQIGRLVDGTRKLTSLQEVVDVEAGTITMQEIFRFEQTGVDSTTGKVVGTFASTGVFPEFIERFRALGIEVPEEIFRERGPAEAAMGGRR
jgi:pilus assembly protein CpaF